MKIVSVLAALPFALVLGKNASAAEALFACPHSVPETSVKLTAPGPEWKPFVSSPLYLSSAALADGPPERLGVLREDRYTQTKTGWTRKYSLKGEYPEGKWLRCDYGVFGEASLAKRLPDEIQECSVTGKKGGHAGETQVEVLCH
ncbi:STY0301 family protein [Massilia sp. YIM B02443]|uniref:STY0301 family protein n=1 Tax=Massilia sp. YIM B02443 TaxID=3050127 RepID=UPI0025B6C6A0|nr:STY0301 family protein [Massilia sp. YIM B02443]MDN4035503.1 hypothetical protein [Massilia sp. YIM B02443]